MVNSQGKDMTETRVQIWNGTWLVRGDYLREVNVRNPCSTLWSESGNPWSCAIATAYGSLLHVWPSTYDTGTC